MATFRLFFLASLIALGGCSGPSGGDQADASQEPTDAPSRTASLHVVVWSTTFRKAVPATGELTADGQTFLLDTRGSAQDGQHFGNLAPGVYHVELEARYEDGEAHRVAGNEKIYLEPGASEAVTVVALDRPGDN